MAMIDRYPRLSNFASQARNEGYADDEIDNYVRAKFLKPAQQEGYGPEEINKFLGVSQPTFFEKLLAGPAGKATRATLEGLSAPVEAAGAMIGGGLHAMAQPIAGAIGGGLAMLRGRPIPEGERQIQAWLEKARPYIAPEPRTPLAKTAVEVASAPFTAGQYLLEKAGLPEEKAAPLVSAVGAALPFALPAARRTVTDLIRQRRTPTPTLPAEEPALTPSQQGIAQTFEQALTEAQRLRQSQQGGILLRRQLSEQAEAGTATTPTAPQPAHAARPVTDILPKRAEPVVTPTTPAAEIVPRLKPPSIQGPPVSLPTSQQIVEVPVDQLKLSKEVPQFKQGASKTTGVVTGEELKGKFDRTGLAPIVVWERNNGDMEIVTGRHRWDLAKRNGEKTMPAQVVREADGFSATMAKIVDAEQNIKDQKGTVFDHARYFREANITPEAARERGLLSRPSQLDAWVLGKDAAGETFDSFTAGNITAPQGVAIARSAPGNADLQRVGLLYSLKNPKAEPAEIGNFVKVIADSGKPPPASYDQMTMFGDDAAVKQAMAMSKSAGAIVNDLKRQRADLGLAKKPQERIERARAQGIDISNPTQVRTRIDELSTDIGKWENWATDPELTAQLRAKLAPKQAPPSFERTTAGEQAIIPGAEARNIPQGGLRATRPQTEAPMELEQPAIRAKEPELAAVRGGAPVEEVPENITKIAELKRELTKQQKRLDKELNVSAMRPPPITHELVGKISDRMAKIQDQIDALEAPKPTIAPTQPDIQARIAQLEKENAALRGKAPTAPADRISAILSVGEQRMGQARPAELAEKPRVRDWLTKEEVKQLDTAQREYTLAERQQRRMVRGGEPTGPFETQAQQVVSGIRNSVAELQNLNERAKITVPQAEEVATTGTLQPKPLRKEFRETGIKPETYSYKFSEGDIVKGQAQVVAVGRQLQGLLRDFAARGEAQDFNVAQLASDRLQRAIKEANQSADLFRKQRFAAGRAVKAYDRAPFPRDILDTFKEIGVVIDGLQSAKERLPIYTNILESMKNIGHLGPLQRQQLWRDFVDAFRLNLFSVTSWSLDLVGNASELGAQVAAGAGRDLVHAAKGDVTFPSIQGFMRTIRERRPLPSDIESRLGTSIGGEHIRGGFGRNWGTFTKRETLPSAAVDYLVGTPLYFKSMADTWAKRFSASSTLWREAIEQADKLNLSGADRQAFYDNFWQKPPESALIRAITEGKKAGFDRVLSNMEENVGRSVTARLLVDAFARWPFQFTRWAGEMLGYNPEIYQRWKTGTLTPEDIGGYLTKTATGWGGLYVIDKLLYDKTDFNSMEYVHPDGNRTRLSNRDPIPTGLFLVALLKGDVNKATGALQYASIPFARLLVGQGGVLGGLISQTKDAIARGATVDPGALKRDSIDTLNRAIPGQALLSAIKTVFDPTIREGIGANLPGVSQTLPPAINPTTGEPLQPRQEMFGFEFPAIGGTPIPGAKRILDPGMKLLSRYGLLVYRGPRTSIAGYPADEVPDDINKEWKEEFGKVRAERLGDLIPQIQQIEKDSTPEELKPEAELYNLIRKEIQNNDAESARIATAIVNGRYGREPIPRERKPTAREKRMPNLGQ